MLSKKFAAGMLVVASQATLAQLPEQRSNAELAAELTELKKALAEQRALLEDLRRQVAEERLASTRGTGAAQSQPQANVPPPARRRRRPARRSRHWPWASRRSATASRLKWRLSLKAPAS